MDDLVYAGNKALELIVKLALFPVVVATAVGLIVGLFQTVTQIQEQTLPFGIKLISVILCVYLLSGWSGEQMLNFSMEMVEIATSVHH